jgi:hypothetical protein
MRRDLARLRAAGLKRARFSARVAKVTREGLIILEDVFSPVGFEDHAWIRPEQWRGRIPNAGDRVEFLASIEPYYKSSGVEDLALVRLEVLP